MPSVEQIETLAALEKTGTFMKAAEYLGKGYSSVVYNLRTLEEELDLKLLDRSAYRTRLTAAGTSILEAGLPLLETQENIKRLAHTLKNGWEPHLSLVCDGILDMKIITSALSQIKKNGLTTKVIASVAYHEQVEAEFIKLNADFMITLSPPKEVDLPFVLLSPLKTLLVASSQHEIFSYKKKLSLSQIKQFTLVTVRGSSTRLGLSTLELERQSPFIVSDFLSKKLVLLDGLGYGWLPEHAIKNELRKGLLKKINFELTNEHKFMPRLYHRPIKTLGRSAQLLYKLLTNEL